jgi:hypothetical protein
MEPKTAAMDCFVTWVKTPENVECRGKNWKLESCQLKAVSLLLHALYERPLDTPC